jgi:hypothetical protein
VKLDLLNKKHFFIKARPLCVEAYLKFNFRQMLGPNLQYKRQNTFVDDKFKTNHVDKLAKNYLIWQAICSCGRHTQVYVILGTLKSNEYIKKCLNKKLLKLIRQHDFSLLFWPNLASIHYFHDAISSYEAKNVTFVEKKHKSPNFPELRQIERYSKLLKCNSNKRSIAALYINLFKRKVNGGSKRWRIKTVDRNVGQTLMSGLMGKVRQFGRGEKICSDPPFVI